MAGCLSRGQGGEISPEDFKRYSENISNVLSSPKGRKKFQDYMETGKLDKKLKLLEFWETYHPLVYNGNRSPEEIRTQLVQDVEKLIEFARNHINFIPPEMEEFERGVRAGDLQAVEQALKKVENDLGGEVYDHFCKYLKKKLINF